MLSRDLKSISTWFRDCLEGRREYTLEGALAVAQMLEAAAVDAAELERAAVVATESLLGKVVMLHPRPRRAAQPTPHGGGDAA